MSQMLDYALRYYEFGWSVIPLKYEGDADERKKPLVVWEPYQHERATGEQIRDWWTQHPTANIGLVTGEISGLVALDFDGPNAAALLRQRQIFLPETAAVQTGKGFHALYRHPGVKIPNRARLLSDGNDSAIDVRGDGGYVVAPPSVHGSGRVYQWVVQPDKLAALPEPVLALLTTPTEQTPREDSGWIASVWQGVGKGIRNVTATRLAGYWLSVTKGNEYATRLALEPWGARCTPELNGKELDATIKSIARREAAKLLHEQAADLPHQKVIEAAQWADELRDSKPREGVAVPIPGMGPIGGLVPGEFLVVAGRPGMGKSSWACQLVVNACVRQHVPTWIVSTEMTRRTWGRWMIGIETGIAEAELPYPLTPSHLASLRVAPIGMTDAGTISIAELRSLAEGRLGVKLIIVDHLTRITATRKENRVLEVGEVARGLKSLSKDLNCTVVALCQLNRRVEGADTKRPRLADLRESGEIEQEADEVLFFWTNEANTKVNDLKMTMSLEKHRHGATIDLPAIFHKRFHTFTLDLSRKKESIYG